MNAPLQRLAVRDVELAWEAHGSGSPPLVLLHGFTGSRADWADVLPDLAQQRRTLLFDQRGHGASSKIARADAYSLTHLVDDLDAFLTALGVESCHLVGHSFGGAVALNYALRRPGRVASLVLVDTAPDVPTALRPELATMAEVVATYGMWPLITQLESEPLEGEAATIARRVGEAAYREHLREQLGAVDPVAFPALVRSLLAHRPIAGDLREITCPTTVIVGADDAAFLEPAAQLEATIAAAERIVIEGAGHSPQRSKPGDWLSAVEGHLQRARAQRSR